MLRDSEGNEHFVFDCHTHMLTTWAYQTGIVSSNLGEGAAISLYLLPVLLVVTVLMLRFARRVEVG